MVRQCDAARASLEQRDAEPVFKMPYLLPDRPMRDVQILAASTKLPRRAAASKALIALRGGSSFPPIGDLFSHLTRK